MIVMVVNDGMSSFRRCGTEVEVSVARLRSGWERHTAASRRRVYRPLFQYPPLRVTLRLSVAWRCTMPEYAWCSCSEKISSSGIMNESGLRTAARVALSVGWDTGPKSIEFERVRLSVRCGVRAELGLDSGLRFCGDEPPVGPEPWGGRAMYSWYSFGGVERELLDGVDAVDATPAPGGCWLYGTYCGAGSVSGSALPSGRMCSMCAILGCESWRFFLLQKRIVDVRIDQRV